MKYYKPLLVVIVCAVLFLSGFAYCSSSAKQTLHIYNWFSYIDDQTIKEFEDKYNVNVIVDIYRTNEELVERLLSGGNEIYDLIFPTDRFIKQLKQLGLLSKLDKGQIRYIRQLRKDLPNSIYDSHNEYSVPYQWGSVAIIYNKTKVRINGHSLDVLFNPSEDMKGRIAIISNMREAIAAALIYNGHDINTCKDEELLAAERSLLKIKPYVGLVESDIVPALVKEDIWLVLSWQGEGIFANRSNPSVDFYLPHGKPIPFCDVIAIPNKAPNRVLAHKFIDYILSPKVNARISNYTAYNTPNRYAVKHIINKKQRELHGMIGNDANPRYVYIRDVGECTSKYNRIWRKFVNK